jgi:hypothetical protein
MKTPSVQGETNILWERVEKTLTLTGEPVLSLCLSWPRMEGKGALARAVNRYYDRLARRWQHRWEREGYLCACAELAQQREKSRPFRPWTAALSGQVTLEEGDYLSIALEAREMRGDGRTLEYRWGDIWDRRTGAPVPLGQLYPGQRRWRRQLLEQMKQAVQESRRQGVCLDQGAEQRLRRWFSQDRTALTPQELLVWYPQCTIAPAVEGAPVLRLPLPPGVRLEEEKKEA